MKRLTLAALSLAMPLAALAAPPADFEQRVESLRKQIGVPGMSVAIVENDQVTFAKGFGVRKLGAPELRRCRHDFPERFDRQGVHRRPIWPSSSTRARSAGTTRSSIACPDFQMYDPWVTREMTIRDLLVHRSGLGLGAGDLLFVPRSSLSRAESVKRLRYIKPATSFRSGFAYDNILYMVAGQLIESVTGQTWEQFTAEHLFKPAGMLHSTSDEAVRFATADRAYPHARMNGGLRGAGDQEVLDERDELGRNAAPAGGLAISANDFARWLRIQLDAGKLPDSDAHLFSAAAQERDVEADGARARVESAAAAGRSAAAVQHCTRWAGTSATIAVRSSSRTAARYSASRPIVALLPEKHVGFSIQINSEDGEILVGLMHELLDHYLGAPANEWPEKVHRLQETKDREGPGGVSRDGGKAGEGRPVAAARTLCRHVHRSVVRQYRGRPQQGRQAHDRFQVDAEHGRHAGALAVRQLYDEVQRQEHRACPRQLRASMPTARSIG